MSTSQEERPYLKGYVELGVWRKLDWLWVDFKPLFAIIRQPCLADNRGTACSYSFKKRRQV
jgi:hypothetical protein